MTPGPARNERRHAPGTSVSGAGEATMSAISVNGARIELIDRGHGRPVLFLHPHIGLDAAAQVLAMLAEGRRLIASPQPRSPPRFTHGPRTCMTPSSRVGAPHPDSNARTVGHRRPPNRRSLWPGVCSCRAGRKIRDNRRRRPFPAHRAAADFCRACLLRFPMPDGGVRRRRVVTSSSSPIPRSGCTRPRRTALLRWPSGSPGPPD